MRSGGSKRSAGRRPATRRQQRPDCTFVFFEQRHCRQGCRRAKKSADELPPLARIGGLNAQSKVSAFLATSVSPAPPPADAQPPPMASASLHLAPAEAWPSERPASPDRDDWDIQRRIFNSWRLESSALLAKLDRLLPAIRHPPSLPKYMEAKLCDHWQQLTADCKQEWRPWQTVACQEEQRKKAQEEQEREARRAAQRAENESLLQRDAARSRAGTVRTKADASPDGRQRGRQAPNSATAGSDLSKKSPKSAAAGRSANIQEAAIAEALEPPRSAPGGDTPLPAGHTDTLSFSLVSKESLRRGWLRNCNERLLEDKVQSALIKLKYATGSYRSRSAEVEPAKRKQRQQQQQQQQQQRQQRQQQQQPELVQVELQFYATQQPFRTQRPLSLTGGDWWRQLGSVLQLPSLLPLPTPSPDAEPRRRFAAAFAEMYRAVVEGHDAASVAAAAQKLRQPSGGGLADSEMQLLRQHFRAAWRSLQETLLLALEQPDEKSATAALRSAGHSDPGLLRLLAARLPQLCAVYCRLLLCRGHDASQLLLYPSGRPALLQCGWSGVTVAMSDADRHSRRLLAVVDASACGFARPEAPDSAPAFLATRSAAMLQDSVGRLVKRLRWPTDARAKLPANLQVKLNSCLTFVCSSRSDMNFLFSAGGRSAQLQAGYRSERHAAVRDRCRDKHGDIAISLSESLRIDGEREPVQWKSDTARRLLARAKMARKQQQQARRGNERQQTDDSTEGSSSAPRSAADDWYGDEELEAARQRVRSLCDAWLQHCRSCLGLQRPATRASRSAASAGVDSTAARDLRSRPSAVGDARRLPSAPAAATDVGDRRPDNVDSPSPADACPAAMRRQLLRQGDCRCRCNYWLQPPALTDLELDAFVLAQAQRSPDQLLVLAVTDSSLQPSRQLAQVCRHYADVNRQRRTSPCTAAVRDPFRLLLYDLPAAANNCTATIPLLLLRHNLRPGDCVIYRSAAILFAGRLPPPEQLRRQLAECRRLAARGCRGLPPDFRLQRRDVDEADEIETAARLGTLEAVSILSTTSDRPSDRTALPQIH